MQPQQPQQPWGPPRPPPSSGANIGLIIGIVFGVFVLGFILLLVLAGVFGYMRAKSAARARAYSMTTSTPAIPSALDRSYITKNGLVTAHYPSDFAAKHVDTATLTISKNLADGSTAIVQVAGVQNPISDDVNEFSRVSIAAMVKNIEAAGDTFTETSRSTKPCLKTYPGLQIQGMFVAKGRTPTNVRTCYFMHDKHGYLLKTIIPVSDESAELSELQSIIDATELN